MLTHLLDEGLDAAEGAAVGCGHVVVHRDQSAIGASHASAGGAEPLKGLRGRDLMHEVAVHVDETAGGRIVDEVLLPDLKEIGGGGVVW